jgi:hypothetical protein
MFELFFGKTREEKRKETLEFEDNLLRKRLMSLSVLCG